jgi:type VI secretion system protein ImpK
MPGYRRSGSGQKLRGGTGGSALVERNAPPYGAPLGAPYDDRYDGPSKQVRPLRGPGREEADYDLPWETEGATEEPRRSRSRASLSRHARTAEFPPETPRLADLCSEFFLLVIQLRGSRQLPNLAALEHQLGAMLEELKGRAAAAAIPQTYVEQASYALIALIDETILHSPAPDKDSWIARPLQMKYFAENVAGQGFFERLEHLRRHDEARDALEVFYQCLALGFEGRYRLEGGGELAHLLASLREELVPRPRDPRRGQLLAPHGGRPDAAAVPPAQRLPLYLLSAAFLAVVIVVLALAAHSVRRSGSEAKGRLDSLVSHDHNPERQEH